MDTLERPLPQDSPDTQKHDSVIQAIADHYHVHESVVRPLYEQELAKLQPQSAHITSFLSVLASKHVCEKLSQTSSGKAR